MAKVKLKKKYISVGAPLWMSQFTAVMLILIVFFMILCTMANEQAAGMKAGDGMGAVRQLNALGIFVGTGTFRFGNHGQAKSFAPNPGSQATDAPPGVHIDLVKGSGGIGNTDLKMGQQQDIKYLSLPIPSEFPLGSAVLTQQLKEEIRRMAIALSTETEPIIVKCFTSEDADAKNASLALARAEALATEMSRFGGIPLSNLKCVGYSDYRYLGNSLKKAASPDLKQLTVIQLSVASAK